MASRKKKAKKKKNGAETFILKTRLHKDVMSGNFVKSRL